jgi:hypothetical protein
MLLAALLFAGVLVAGCSDDTSASDTTVVATTATVVSPLYSAGDIVKNPSASATSALLIVGYDAGTDMYERAVIYPNSDGSWGYRADSKTATISRPNLEKVYTKKVETVEVSSIPTKKPTTATTVATTATTAASVTATSTTASANAPVVKSIDPDKATAGTVVDITELVGQKFQTDAVVTLKRSGETSITATDVELTSAELITCTFHIPSGTEGGYWDVVVTNPDKLSDAYENGFYIVGNTTATATTTTSSTSTSTLVTILSIAPNPLSTGGLQLDGKEMTVMGTNFSAVSSIKLTSGSYTITSSGWNAQSTQMATAIFSIPAGEFGTFKASAMDSSGNEIGSLANALTIQSG